MDALPDATAQADLIRSGEVSAQELVEGAIERIETLNGDLNAVIHPLYDEARATEPADGPFTGVPLVIKDLVCAVENTPHHEGMRFLRDLGFRADADSWLASRLRAAGFVFVGKTNTPELGILPTTEPDAYGPTRNPWNVAHSPGGSSGGSASAVASGMVALGHAGDGGGSIRIPASCCGLFGLKPSRGRVSSAPFGSLEGLSTAGSLARTVEDAAHFLDVLEGYEPGDPWWAPPPEKPFRVAFSEAPPRLRIAVTSVPPIDTPVDPACVRALESAAAVLTDLGHDVREASPPWSEPDLFHRFITVWQLGPALHPVDEGLMTALNRELVESARTTSAADYGRAVASLQLLARRIVSFWSDTDVVLTPTLALPPVPIGWQEAVDGAFEQLLRNTAFTPFTAVANLTGQPAMSLPLGWSDDGLPIGVQAIGPPAGDALLLALAAQVERARPWADRRPPVS
jgi:amidase